MKLEDVEKQATPGPLIVKPHLGSLPGYYIASNDLVMDQVATVFSDSDLADAALLAHWYNVGPKLLEAVRGEKEHCEAESYDGAVERLTALIAEAEEVKGL